MENQRAALQLCPTRIDAQPVLFAHKVTRGQCQDRQRGRYHKCFTCAYNNAYVALHGEPAVPPSGQPPARKVAVDGRGVAIRAG
jgi:hypothetical protein